MTLEPGIPLVGTVVDDQGRPVAGAVVQATATVDASPISKKGKTDSNGKYRFVFEAPLTVTVAVDVPGFAPQFRRIDASKDMEPVTLALDQGRKIGGVVNNRDGKPIGGASVSIASWEGQARLGWATVTDAEGRFACENAPHGRLVFAFEKEGYSNIYMDAQGMGTNWAVTLSEPFSLSGKVVDAETGEPIHKFELTRGSSYDNGRLVHWDRRNPEPGNGGEYTVTVDYETGSKVIYAVRADGYIPATSPELEGVGKHSFDFKLKRGIGLSGVIESAEGKRLAGATLLLLNRGESAYMDKPGQFRLEVSQCQSAVSDDQGRFQFQPDIEPKFVVVAHDEGFASVSCEKASSTGKVRLEPWGKVTGSVRLKPGKSKRLVALHSMHYTYSSGTEITSPMISIYLNTEPNEDGIFCFEKVPPGERKVYVQYKFDSAVPGPIPLSHGRFIQVKAGETHEVCLGANGRTVVGRAQVSDADAQEVNWLRGMSVLARKQTTGLGSDAPFKKQFANSEERRLAFEAYSRQQQEFWSSEAGRAQQRDACEYILLFEEDGSFHVDAVPPGAYTLRISPGSNTESSQDAFARRYGMPGSGRFNLSKEVTIPVAGSASVEPFDLGTLELKAQSRPGPPAFVPE
jgi:hypothetical protein